jgi:RNA polymerase sigma-70 factor (ECF subfamily)
MASVSTAHGTDGGRADVPERESSKARRFRETMIPHLDAAYNLARFLCRDPDAAQDVVQEAYLRAYRSFAGYRGGGDRAWILAIVRNCHRDWWAQAKQRAITEPLEGTSHISDAEGEGGLLQHRDMPAQENTPEQDAIDRSEAAAVRRHLDTLPESFREVLVLRELEDLSYREIADITATPIGTVMSRLARARSLFRASWERRAGSPEGKKPGGKQPS